MTLEEAIEIVIADSHHPNTEKFPELRDAEKLLIEAGKRVQDMRISPCTTADEILPGETKE